MAGGKRLPVDLDELHAGFSRGAASEHPASKKKRKKGARKHNVSKGEYTYDVSPDHADDHLKVDETESASSSSSSSSDSSSS